MRTRGVTLLEIMVVVAIIGIIGSLAVTTTEGLRARTAPRNAAADFSSALSMARARATERGSDVWVIVYPSRGLTTGSTGNGAWFIYEDPDVNFGRAGAGDCSGSTGAVCNFQAFNPPDAIYPPAVSATSSDRLIDRDYLNRAARENVKFGNDSDPSVVFTQPFGASGTGLNAAVVKKDCSFCSGTGATRRGAIIFNGDGAARFVDGDGLPSWEPMAALSMEGALPTAAYGKAVTLFGIAAVTGYVGVFK